MMNYWNQSSTATKVIIVAGLGLLGVYQLPGSAPPTPQVRVNLSVRSGTARGLK